MFAGTAVMMAADRSVGGPDVSGLCDGDGCWPNPQDLRLVITEGTVEPAQRGHRN